MMIGILRLTMHFGAGASTRAIGRELGIAPSTMREYLGRAASSESAPREGSDRRA